MSGSIPISIFGRLAMNLAIFEENSTKGGRSNHPQQRESKRKQKQIQIQ
jgi:hypothetical protein